MSNTHPGQRTDRMERKNDTVNANTKKHFSLLFDKTEFWALLPCLAAGAGCVVIMNQAHGIVIALIPSPDLAGEWRN